MSQGLLYVAACVVVPVLWGVTMFYAFDWIQRRRRNKALEERPPSIDYTI